VFVVTLVAQKSALAVTLMLSCISYETRVTRPPGFAPASSKRKIIEPGPTG
jgi:hypothetical protein